MINESQKRGEEARRAKEAVEAAWSAKLRDHEPAQYQDLLNILWGAQSRALPSCDPDFLTRLNDDQPLEIELAIAFLEADPWFFRSGYEKQAITHRLKRVRLDPSHQDRLRTVILRLVDTHDRREFRHYARLARAGWSADLEAALHNRLSSLDANIRRRAGWILAAQHPV